jgi:hypothetical protein
MGAHKWKFLEISISTHDWTVRAEDSDNIQTSTGMIEQEGQDQPAKSMHTFQMIRLQTSVLCGSIFPLYGLYKSMRHSSTTGRLAVRFTTAMDHRTRWPLLRGTTVRVLCNLWRESLITGLFEAQQHGRHLSTIFPNSAVLSPSQNIHTQGASTYSAGVIR